MRSFPSDIQTLKLKFHMQPNNPADSLREWFVNLDVPSNDPEILEQPDYFPDSLGPEDYRIKEAQGNPVIDLDIVFYRRHGYHTLAATVPLTIVIALAPSSYAIDVDDIGDRLSTGLTLLLSAVAVKFIIAPDLPRVPYPTRLDVDTILAYMFILLIILGQVYFKEWDDTASQVSHMIMFVLVLFLW